MPNTTISMEWLSHLAWSLLGHVVRRTTDTVLAFSELRREYTSGQAGYLHYLTAWFTKSCLALFQRSVHHNSHTSQLEISIQVQPIGED